MSNYSTHEHHKLALETANRKADEAERLLFDLGYKLAQLKPGSFAHIRTFHKQQVALAYLNHIVAQINALEMLIAQSEK